MQKTIWIFFLSIIVEKGAAQGTTNIQHKDTLREVNMPVTQDREWDRQKQYWIQHYFYDFLSKRKIKISCAYCPSMSVDVIFDIDMNGKFISKITNVDRCDRKISNDEIKSLYAILKKMKFPKNFYNKVFIVRLGQSLRC